MSSNVSIPSYPYLWWIGSSFSRLSMTRLLFFLTRPAMMALCAESLPPTRSSMTGGLTDVTISRH